MLAIDAMGGDNAPREIVIGALNAAKKGIAVRLFGDEYKISMILYSVDNDWRTLPLSIEHCTELILMDEEPSKAVMRKKDASLVRAAHSVAQGKCTGLVSAGNSGAVLAAGSLIVGRIPGIMRPAVGSFLPTKNGTVFCLDLGANVDCKPEFLEQFAYMGSLYVQHVKNIASPRIGLLSNGHEAYKGSQLVKEVYARLEQSTLHFVGNIEARDVFDDRADVIVCDGFSGNILLKSMQGLSATINYWIRQEAQQSLIYTIGLLISRGLFKALKQKTDYARIGGALLLGTHKPVVLAHGCSQAEAVCNAIVFAQKTVDHYNLAGFNNALQAHIAVRNQRARAPYELSV